jgi:hypothetical protein
LLPGQKALNEIKKILDRNDVGEDNLYNIYLQFHVINNKLAELQKIKKNIFDIINSCFAVGEKNSDIYGILEHCSNNSYKELINCWNFDEIAFNYIEKYMGNDQEYCDVMHIIADRVKRLNRGGRCDLTALDNSYRMLLKTKDTVPWAKVVIGDILERRDASLGVFDIVVSTYTLHHIPYESQMQAFLNLLEYCKPGGSLVFVDRDFWDENGRERLEKLLVEAGKTKRLEDSRSEYYLYGKSFTVFLTKNHYAYECRRYGVETTILIIKNH